MTVVDASVAVKWFFPERGSSEANALLESGEALTAPALVRIEVFAAITGKVRLREILPTQARAACALWSGFLQSGVLSLVKEDDQILSVAVELALSIPHPLQDCLYLALAQREQAPLVTADRKFWSRANPLYQPLRLLAE